MYGPELQLAMARALDVPPSEVTAVNIDAQGTTVSMTYVINYSTEAESRLSDPDNFYIEYLGPEYAAVDGLSELLGLEVGPTTTTTSTTTAPIGNLFIFIFFVSGSFLSYCIFTKKEGRHSENVHDFA